PRRRAWTCSSTSPGWWPTPPAPARFRPGPWSVRVPSPTRTPPPAPPAWPSAGPWKRWSGAGRSPRSCRSATGSGSRCSIATAAASSARSNSASNASPPDALAGRRDGGRSFAWGPGPEDRDGSSRRRQAGPEGAGRVRAGRCAGARAGRGHWPGGAGVNEELRLYSYWRSSAAYRVRIGLNLKGLAYETVPVHLLRDGGEQLAPGFAATNPQKLVPVLQHGQRLFRQSLAILEYIDEVWPDPPLLP